MLSVSHFLGRLPELSLDEACAEARALLEQHYGMSNPRLGRPVAAPDNTDPDAGLVWTWSVPLYLDNPLRDERGGFIPCGHVVFADHYPEAGSFHPL